MPILLKSNDHSVLNTITNPVSRICSAHSLFRVFIWLLTLVALSVSQAASARSLMLVGDRQTRNILRYDVATGQFVDTFITQGTGGLEGAVDFAFGPDGLLYVASTPVDALGVSQILKYDPDTGAFLGIFAELAGQSTMAFGPDGNLYVADRASPENRVRKYNGTTGAFTGYFTEDVGLSQLLSLTFGPDGNLYVGDSPAFGAGQGTVTKFNGATGAFIGTFNDAIGGMPHDLAFGPDGNLRVPVYDTDTVLTLDGATGQTLDSFNNGLAGPGWLEFNAVGDLYVANCFGNRITKYAGGVGSALTVFASGEPLTGCPLAIRIAFPQGAEDSDGDGIPNNEDECPDSDRSATVAIDGCDSKVTNTVFPSGCTLADLLADCADKARKHRKFVHCIARLTHTMQRIGIITGQQQDAIQSCATQADLP